MMLARGTTRCSGFRLVVLCLVASAFLGSTVSAETAVQAVPEGEIEIDARSVEIDRENGQAVFEGDVRLRHGDLVLRCQRLVAEVGDGQRLVAIEAAGGVGIEAGDVTATAGSASYDPSTGVLTLRGQPQLRHPSGLLRGRVIVVRVRDARVTVEEAHGVFRLR
jgi:lipopolysaccharide transport protein LptA